MAKVDGRTSAATGLEDLGSGPRRAAGLVILEDEARPPPAKVTRAMALGFQLAAYFFLGVVVSRLMLAAWIGAGAVISAGAGLTLFHSGTLDPDLYAHSLVVAAIVDAVLLLGIGLVWLVRRFPPDEAMEFNVYGRHPVGLTAVSLLAALGACVALLGSSTATIADRITTVVVLASALYFSVLVVAWSLALAFSIASAFARWALSSPYLTGVFTVLLVAGGLGGSALRASRWARTSLAELRQDVDVKALSDADGLVDFLATAMCVAANEALEGGVAGTSAPECARLLARGSGTSSGRPAGSLGAASAGQSGGGASEDCFAELAPQIPQRRQQLERLGYSYDAQDAVMSALVLTCTKEPPPADLSAYFFTVAKNQALRRTQEGLRDISCSSLSQDEELYRGKCAAPDDPPEQREAKLALLWKSAMCDLDPLTAEVLKDRLIENLRFRDIGRRRGLTEVQARSTFNNAIKKFRRRSDLCFMAGELRP